MATYKIPQNVEAEDKLIGPFSFKQFIFLVIAAAGMGIAFLLSRMHIALVLIPAPVIIVCLVLGLYRRSDQPVETYLLAMLNFNFKPRKRSWDPEGWHETVHLIAPKKKMAPAQKGSLQQVHGQLEQLANIVDSRGWAAKRPELNDSVGNLLLDNSDRLISTTEQQPTVTEPLDIHAKDDILDSNNNPDLKDLGKLAEETETQVKNQAIAKMQAAKASTGNKTETEPTYNPYPQMQQKVVPAQSPK